jgi:hypothetical protein
VADAYTHLGLGADNPWEIKASLYNSIDMLKSKPSEAKKNAKIDNYFTKKKDLGNWQVLEQE